MSWLRGVGLTVVVAPVLFVAGGSPEAVAPGRAVRTVVPAAAVTPSIDRSRFDSQYCASGFVGGGGPGLRIADTPGLGTPQEAMRPMVRVIRQTHGPVTAVEVSRSSTQVIVKYVGASGPVAELEARTLDAGGWELYSHQMCAAHAPPGTPVRRATRLVLSRADPGARMQAAVEGVLGVDSAGCITLGRHVLVAPRHSRLGSDRLSVEIAGLGTFHLGDRVSSGGGFLEPGHVPSRDIPSDYKGCDGEDFVLVTP